MWVQAGLFLIQAIVLAWTARLVRRYTDETADLRKATERYTDETAGLRKEMVRQNKLSLRPIVVPRYRFLNGKEILNLKNVGNGCALNISASPASLGELDGKPLSVRYPTVDCLAPGSEDEIQPSLWIGEQEHTPPDPLVQYSALSPGTERTLNIRFGDVEGHAYCVSVVVTVTATNSLYDPDVRLKLGEIREL